MNICVGWDLMTCMCRDWVFVMLFLNENIIACHYYVLIMCARWKLVSFSSHACADRSKNKVLDYDFENFGYLSTFDGVMSLSFCRELVR